MPIKRLPQDEGEFSPREAESAIDVVLTENLATDKEIATRTLAMASAILAEWYEDMQKMFKRWRVCHHMLRGNTLDVGGPEDVHVPELHKAVETMVPRIEEQVVEHDPWFTTVGRKQSDMAEADAVAALMDWLFDQAKVRDTIQPAARNMIICQAAVWHMQWENRIQKETIRTVEKGLNEKTGRLEKKLKVETKETVTYSGLKVTLIDPFDFIIDTKYTNPQDATYAGHRVWLTVDEIRRVGKQLNWINLGEELTDNTGNRGAFDTRHYSVARDPTSNYTQEDRRMSPKDTRPGKVEVTVLYVRCSPHNDDDFDDYEVVLSGGKLIHSIRRNPHDKRMRPYAVARAAKNGHSFYGIGPLDNAVRLNQHLDRYHQIAMRAAEVAACPMVFAEEDSDIPNSLYKVQPFTVMKGVGKVTFTQIPDGVLDALPVVMSVFQHNIEETVGSFRIQMGQDTNGTATEASLSLQEGNRRMRALIRGFSDGLQQMLECGYALARQYMTDDLEFPVLGKRALDLKRMHLRLGPADIQSEVRFEMVGLASIRTYGMKATGLMAFTNAMTPFIVANPTAVDQVRLMHMMAREQIGIREADQLVKLRTPVDKLKSQEEENEGLIAGVEIEIDEDDNHEEHQKVMKPLFDRAIDRRSKMHEDVRRVVIQHYVSHEYARKQKQAEEQAQRSRNPGMNAPVEAGGQMGDGGTSPKAGGFSDSMMQGQPGGQSPGENPGPASDSKFPRPGTARRGISQMDNQ